ncbi:MAG: neutral/alkaline non-lysosomal ceramidase N-terminal domain-containing protein [Saprospiraceae bacterium]
MPDLTNLTPEWQKDALQFVVEQKQFRNTPEGQKMLLNVTKFISNTSSSLSQTTALESLNFAEPAGQTMQWIRLLPESLVNASDSPLLSIKHTDQPNERNKILGNTLQKLTTGTLALIYGGGIGDGKDANFLMQAVFGADKASMTTGAKLVSPKFPAPKFPPGIILPDLDKLVLEGTLRELLSTMAVCGLAARENASFLQILMRWGNITGIMPPRACAGDTVTILGTFGNSPPFSEKYPDIMVSFPKIGGGCTYGFISDMLKNNPGLWKSTGIEVVLPQDIGPGCIGLYQTPAPVGGSGCEPGSLQAAAGMFQSLLADMYGSYGAQLGQIVVNATGKVANTHFGLPCASCLPNDPAWINAGPPVIHEFSLVEPGFIYPYESFKLRWRLENTDRIEIITRNVQGSPNPHELPQVQVKAGQIPTGELEVSVSCTKRWRGEYVLRAYNDNGCNPSGNPVEASVVIDSDRWSQFLIGVGKADVTDDTNGLGMFGWADEAQKTTGVKPELVTKGAMIAELEVPEDIEMRSRLYSRAFIIAKSSNISRPACAVFVVADIMSCTQPVKLEVVKRLSDLGLGHLYTTENVQISGTHTHCGPGGYSSYFLYNLTIGGFDQINFDIIVKGIVSSILEAHQSLASGRVYVNKGDLMNCGENRSKKAYYENSGTSNYQSETDTEMLLLKFVKDVGENGHPQTIGVLNWYAIHPTSMGQKNTLITGDNKGWASFLFETYMGMKDSNPTFVAAFASACEGDVSGNVKYGIPQGSPDNAALFNIDTSHMKEYGELQFFKAKELLDTASEELGGVIEYRYTHLDMSNIAIENETDARTWPAALGISFGAGSSEDSFPNAYFLGITILSGLREGITDSNASQKELDRSKDALFAINTFKLMLKGWYLPPLDRNDPMIAAYIKGHSPKPIMFPVGIGTLKGKPAPLVPNVIPIQLIKIGKLAIAGVPGEFTTMAGRRLKSTLSDSFGKEMRHVAITNYANAYSSYITTREEYNVQEYEGASNLYGPHTLAAYRQEFARLAAAIIAKTAIDPGQPFLQHVEPLERKVN